ncbi:hypothetical protein SMC26_18410 [Actinomadura fulvescens]|uniref:Uncharacterized protein n=1 Tax=Actinomadura fulvescens TaxID=46160 RepID=A0ABN3QEY4_9ACTN
MDQNTNAADQEWAPDACTLPTAERPLRTAEFDKVFTKTVTRAEFMEPARLRLSLSAGPRATGEIAALLAAETACCSFFTFTLTIAAETTSLEVTVPARRTDVLNGFAAQARAAITARAEAGVG